VRERQKIISTDQEDQDVIGLARQGSEACVQVFFVRRGRLLGRESFFLDRLSGVPEGEILSAFVRQFYTRNVEPAREVLLSAEITDAALVAEWLGTRRGGRVDLVVPHRGRKRELCGMVEDNAALALQTHLLARDSRRQVVLEDLQRSLSLPGPPHRIEGFDISNIQGQEAVGSMVVWEDGGLKKDDYKRFRIRTVPGADDYAMMDEVLRRRYGKALEEGGALPDLVLLDGGRGQLNVGVRALEALGLDFIPIVSLAKREEEVYRPESLHPLVLDPASPALHALQRIRDEAHRFAITYHKKLRSKRTLVSVLDQIPGIGPTLRTSLLRHLGSARRVREASVAELAAVPKVTPKLAQRIHDFFHPPPAAPPAAAEPAAAGPGLAPIAGGDPEGAPGEAATLRPAGISANNRA
jgi:excinuclease ABC subunit C